jgi:serine protease
MASCPLRLGIGAPRTGRLRSLAVCLALVLSTLPMSARAVAPVSRPWVPGRLFLKLHATPAVAAAKSSPGLQALLGEALDTARPMTHRVAGPQAGGLDRLLTVRLPEDVDVPALALKLSHLPEVEYAEPVWLRELADGGPLSTLATPNDPAYAGSLQTYLDKLQVELAWDVQKSATGSPRPIVCVVDGGTNWQHEDLGANMWTNPGEIPGNGVDDDGNGYVDDIHGWDFAAQDGDPRGSTSAPSNANHGTHTGGLLAAVTDNAIGIASASWNPLLMAVNASGSQDRTIAYGYDGIVYAAENGATVISLSWGGSGGTLAEQDVIDYATAQGALVVAAAGNGNSSELFYPAAYQSVIAVANVTTSDTRYAGLSGSNYGGWVDVAAPGTTIYSLFDQGTNNAYGYATGTSMACPVAAAVAALIKAAHPTWEPAKVGEQLRVSCDDINALNPGYEDLLGKGRVNAYRAVTLSSPGLRLASWTLDDSGGDGELNQGESVLVSVVVRNYLAPAVNPMYTLSTTSPWISITDGSQAGSTLLEDGAVALTNAFAFTIDPNAPPGAKVDLRVDFAATGYSDFQFIPIVLEPVVETLDVNQVHVSLTATGGIGWIGFPSGQGEGQGFSFAGGPNLLYEGALLLGTSPTRLSDAARDGGEHTDFAPVLHQPVVRLTPGPTADQEIRASFTDSINATTPVGVRVDLASWAHAGAPDDDFVLVAFEILNRSVSSLDSLYVGVFFDWDIDESHYFSNHAAYDATRKLGYAWDEDPSLPHVGIMTLSGSNTIYTPIPNNGYGAPWGLYDGFSKTEKWDVLRNGNGLQEIGPTDISNAISSGPYRVPVGGRALAVFALLAGTDLAELQASADRARTFYTDSVLTDVGDGAPPAPRAWLGAPVPNPFNPRTTLTLELRSAIDVDVGVYDARGRRVRTLAAGEMAAGRHPLAWDGTDGSGGRVASGVYFARLRAGSLLQVRRLVLAK